jgi:hypothetical protein
VLTTGFSRRTPELDTHRAASFVAGRTSPSGQGLFHAGRGLVAEPGEGRSEQGRQESGDALVRRVGHLGAAAYRLEGRRLGRSSSRKVVVSEGHRVVAMTVLFSCRRAMRWFGTPGPGIPIRCSRHTPEPGACARLARTTRSHLAQSHGCPESHHTHDPPVSGGLRLSAAGESAAHRRWRDFLERRLSDYANQRQSRRS